MIRINGTDLKTSRPSNLDEQLIAATGCSSSEIGTVLAGGPDLAARALRPFIDPETLPGGQLAAAIAADGDALLAIRKLYDDAPASKAEGK
ncbi:hypothetical protein [Sphingomonas immobilis]|uniref:Uncharacterized protein n=1 Tax=Sphingomonas immobilis TaxID=3063997 RepID=A0ABT9A268_9SPHN|nr:hypothetical protein [Sphingomonas sp. CA1-15]MDO7843454.1 hypothetical protein [Sphingomonas sp. CA1-15]